MLNSILKQLSELNLDPETSVTLNYSEGTDVFVHNETAMETAISETDVIAEFCDLVATRGLDATDAWGGHIINECREKGLLEDYERDFTFSDYLQEALTEDFYDQEFIQSSIERYDYKRGFCTLEATVQVSLVNLLASKPPLGGWTVSVRTPNGTLTLD